MNAVSHAQIHYKSTYINIYLLAPLIQDSQSVQRCYPRCRAGQIHPQGG